MTYWHLSPRHSANYAIFLSLACLLEDGHIHRAVRIGAQLSVLEDLALFPEPQPVESMKLYRVSWVFEEPGGENGVRGQFMSWPGSRNTFSPLAPFL